MIIRILLILISLSAYCFADGGSIDFDGTDDEIYNTSISGIDNDLMSFSAWVNADTSASSGNYFAGS